MLYLMDTANIEEIKKGFEFYPLSGVTTNPTLITKEKKGFKEILKDIRNIIGENSMLHVQAVGRTAEQIEKEALYLQEVVGENFYIKIPVTPDGIKAIKKLTQKGVKITATAIFNAQQALMAAEAGAEFTAPYINRLDNICGDGVKVVEEIISLYKLNGLNTKVLAASFKNAEQVHKVALCGVHSVTLNYEILEKLLYHPLTDISVDKFIEDWEKFYGSGKLTTDVK
ncbi:fructose-6-phosphate aldolase 2 [Caloramator quimbayensis]|uniref:Fructose-6-phosphate aldolase 2 n=1 Tax=Caloramator quimbayensis TaxID=1147123 RepID=A0A1T4WNJ8_9CLOT|nr:transaldolase family protein [Caloramator quimbayensis]SKA78707.1 fructose-6-phosphate aldolase 2 [Caloramator quimbayensis]